MLDIRVTERVQALLLNASRVEDAVVAPAEVDWAGVVAVFIGDQGCIFTEVPLRTEVEDGVNGGLVERHIALAGRCLELADLHLSAAGEFCTIASGDLFHAALEVHHPIFKVNVAVEQTEDFARPQSCVEHQRISGCLLIDSLPVAPCPKALILELFDFLRREGRDRLKGGEVLLALRRHEVCLFDHRDRGHRILLNQFLLCQIAEVVGQQVVYLFDGVVGVTFLHPVVEQLLYIRG